MSILQKPHNILQAVSIGILFGAAFLSPWLWWVALCGGVWFVLFVTQLQSAKQAWWGGWLVGFVKMLLVISWGWYIFPVDWMGFNNLGLEITLLTSFWFLSAAALGAGYGVLALLLWSWRKRQAGLPAVIATGFLLADMIGSLLFSAIMAGPGSTLNIQYSNGWVGYTLAEQGIFLAAAGLGGVFILNILFGLGTALFYWLFINKKYLPLAGAVLVILLTSQLQLLPRAEVEGYSVAVVHTAIVRQLVSTEAERRQRQGTYEEILEALSEHRADYVLWPEDSRMSLRVVEGRDMNTYLQNRLGSHTIVIDSARRDLGDTVLRAYLYDTATGETYNYDKQYLVPQGEYLPYIYRLLSRLFVANGNLTKVLEDTSYRPGIDQRRVAVPAYFPVVLFCFESVDPLGARRVLKARPKTVPFVAHIMSHGWFQRPPYILWHQLDAMLRVQAVWNQAPIVQAANNAPAKLYEVSGASRVLPSDVVGDGWSISYVEL